MLSVIPNCNLRAGSAFYHPRGIENFVPLTEEVSRLKTRADWMLDTADVPFAPINDFSEVMDDPQVLHLGTFARVAPRTRYS